MMLSLLLVRSCLHAKDILTMLMFSGIRICIIS